MRAWLALRFVAESRNLPLDKPAGFTQYLKGGVLSYGDAHVSLPYRDGVPLARLLVQTPMKKRRELLRAQVEQEFPPKRRAAKTYVGIARQIRDARMAQGLTWYAVAKKAGIPNSGTVRAIEEGQDAKLSSVEAVAAVLGLKLSAIDATL